MSNCSPAIVSSPNYLNQTAAIGTTTLFTPSVTGLYRINAFVEFDPTGGNNVSDVDLTYTDSFGNSHGGAIDNVTGGGLGGSAILYLSSSHSLQFHTGLTNGNSITYNLYFVIEQF